MKIQILATLLFIAVWVTSISAIYFTHKAIVDQGGAKATIIHIQTQIDQLIKGAEPNE